MARMELDFDAASDEDDADDRDMYTDPQEAHTSMVLSRIMEGLSKLELSDLSGSEKSCALVMASRRGLVECIDWLLTAGASPNAEDEFGYTPLMFAAAQGLEECVQDMLRVVGCMVNKRTDSQQTALHMASSKGHTRCASLLLQHGAVVNAADDWGATPLIMGVCSGCASTVSLLLNAGARPEMTDLRGFDALMHVARSGHMDVLQLLLQHGCDPNKAYKTSALHEAARFGHQRCVASLLQAGALAYLQDMHGYLPIELATHTDQAAVVRCFLQNSAPQEHVDQALAAAAFAGAGKCLQVLLDHGASPNAVDKHGIPAFFLAIAQNNLDMAVSFIQHNCSVNKSVRKVYFFNTQLHELSPLVNTDAVLPLHIASLRGYAKLIHVLVAAGASIEPFSSLLDEGLVPPTVTMDTELMSWLVQRCLVGSAPPSLRQLCRTSIRFTLASSDELIIKSLPLPQLLQDFLLFKELNQIVQDL